MKTAVLTKNGANVIETVELAVDMASRIVGLLGRSSLGKQRAMYLSPCASIHTFGMKFPIDVFFLGRDMEVKKIVRHVMPWRVVCGGAGAWSVIEVESGWLPPEALVSGDRVVLQEKSLE